jgi:HAD superfamily hydrolase (TIGR01509 family)
MVSPVRSLQNARHLKAVVFDMDGVIVDSHAAHRIAWREFLRTLGKHVTDSELDFVLDGHKRREIFFHFLGPLTDEQLEAYGNRKDELFWQAAPVTPVPGVHDFVRCLHAGSVRMVVATSASRGRARFLLDHLALLPYFDALVTGNDVSIGKPDPSIYRLACERISCPAESAVAIEDAVSGVIAAKAAGLKCIGIIGHQTAESLTAAGADHVVRDFCNLSLGEFGSLLGMRSQLPGTA